MPLCSMELIWTKIASSINVMVITEMHICRLCGYQVLAITFFSRALAYGFLGFLGRSVMKKITRTFGRLLICALPLVVLWATGSTVANAQAIGKATSVKPQAEANARTLAAGSDVFSQETIRTGESGVADLRFHDNSNLSVGPKSSVRLDKYVYDPNKSASAVAIEATRGSFRFVTGSRGEGSYQVKTPYGSLGVRG
jgi:hypothetical protein